MSRTEAAKGAASVAPFSILILGPPGTGKSAFAGSIAEVVGADKALLLATKPREARSWGYRNWPEKNRETYYDADWIPSLGRFECGGYLSLLRRIHELYQDESFDAVVLDPFTDAALLIEHEILKPMGVGSPGELTDGRAFYRQLKDKAEELGALFLNLSTEAATRPKTVIVTMHVQPPKDDQQVVVDGQKTTKPSADKVARGIEYEGSVLPMIEGAYRRKMAGEYDIVIYSGIDERLDRSTKPPKMRPWYYIQVSPDRDRHSKIAIGVTQEQRIDNNVKALLGALQS